MKCNKKNCPLVGNNENCDIKDCKWRTEDATDTDLIRRSDAIKEIMNKPAWHGSEGSWFHSDDIKNAINNIPAVEPKHGEWIINNNGWAYCSECESLGLESYDFCPYCGAKMRGADE